MGRPMNCRLIRELFLGSVQVESGPTAHSNLARWLKPFDDEYGGRSIASIKPQDLILYRAHLVKSYKPSTAAAYLSAAKRMIAWAAAMDMRPPFAAAAIKPPRQDPPKDKAWTPEQVTEHLDKTQRYDQGIYLWNAIQYLCCLRPSEVLRLVRGEGRWTEDGVFVPDQSKTYRKNGVPRHLVICPTAMEYLTLAKPRWTSIQTYWDATYTASGVGPHRYRHSAASHLTRAGASYDDVRLMLGHYDHRNTMIYSRPNWQRLRLLAEDCLKPQVPPLAQQARAKRVYLPTKRGDAAA